MDEIHAITQNDDAPAGDITGIENEPVLQVMIFMDEKREKELLAKLPQCRGARWYPTFFDLSPKGGTKVKGIDRFLAYYGIPLSDTLSFGDGGNDREMLEHTALSVAMGNSSSELKSIADYVTGEAGSHGIADALA